MSQFFQNDSDKISQIKVGFVPVKQGFLDASIEVAKIGLNIFERAQLGSSLNGCEIITDNIKENKNIDPSGPVQDFLPAAEQESQELTEGTSSKPIKEKPIKEKPITKKNKSLNQTKNIPKNFGKAIISFITKRKFEFRDKATL